jgi:hypothetical protein
MTNSRTTSSAHHHDDEFDPISANLNQPIKVSVCNTKRIIKALDADSPVPLQEKEEKEKDTSEDINKIQAIHSYLKKKYDQLKLVSQRFKFASPCRELSSFTNFCKYVYGISEVTENNAASLGDLDISKLSEIVILKITNEGMGVNKEEYEVIPAVRVKLLEHSDFFRAMLGGDFREGREGFVTLHHKNPRSVSATITNIRAEFPSEKASRIFGYSEEICSIADNLFMDDDYRFLLRSSKNAHKSNKEKHIEFKDEINEIEHIRALIGEEKIQAIEDKFYKYLNSSNLFLIKTLFQICGYKTIKAKDKNDKNYLHKAISGKIITPSIIKFLIQQAGTQSLYEADKNGLSFFNYLQQTSKEMRASINQSVLKQSVHEDSLRSKQKLEEKLQETRHRRYMAW